MAAMTMDREPEVARFIDTYKFDQEMSTRRDRFGGGTSLPLHSDGYEDKQRSLRDERHRDWLGQQEKKHDQSYSTIRRPNMTPVSYGPQSPADYEDEINKMTDRYHTRYNEVVLNAHNEPQVVRNSIFLEPRDPVYYRVGTPEQGFPGLGNYSKQRQENNKMRQKEYNAILKKQKQLEQQKIEARRRSPPRPAQPQGPQIDYNLAGQQAKAEEKRAYQDYMGKYQYTANAPPKPTFDYEENKKVLNEERKREYNQLMEKKAKEEQYWQMRGRPVTPPGGLNIGNYDRQLKETAAAKKKEYKEMLDQQKFEQQKLRAMDRVADLSPKYVSYRESERPLVGSPRDVNYYMQEKFEKDKFRKDLRNSPQRDFSPPGKNQVAEQSSMMEDANFKAFMEVEKDKAMNKRKYAEELLQQQKEHMYLRARQEPEMAVIDRNAPPQHLANKPPAGPGYNRSRDEPLRQNPAYWNEGRQAHGPRSFDSDVSRRSSGIPANVPNSGPASELQRKRLPRKRHIEKITEETLNKQVSDRRSSAGYYHSPTESNDYVKQEGFDKDVSNGKSPTPKPKVASRKGEIRKTPGPRSNYSYLSDSSYGSPVAYKKRTKLQTIPESPNHKHLGVVNEDEDDSSEEEIIDDEFDRKLPEWLPRSPDSQLEPLVSQSPDGRKKQHKVIYYKRQNDKQTESYVTYMRQNKKHGREGKQANDQRSESQMSNTREFKNDSKSRAIPDRERYGQPPFPGEGHSKAERENKNKDIPERKSPVRSPRSPPKSPLRSPPKSPLRSPPKSPLKSPSRRYMSERRRVSDAEHAVEGTPLAFKTESRPIPERPQYGQPPYPGHGQYVPEGEMLNPDAIERPPVGPQPRALEKLSPVWLKPQDDDRPVEGTPLAFKTNSYSRQPPPAPEQAFNGPPAFSNNGQRPIENGMDGFYERPVRTPGRPRSRRSVESERKYAPTNVDSGAQISPRRMKNTFYEDSQEVSSKRIEASKERQKDYNDFIRLKNEEKRRYEEEKHHQQISKPAEVVKNQYYSSDDYEKFQKEIQRKQGEEYRDFLAKSFQPPPGRIGLPLGQYKYEPKRLAMEAERNTEYNNLLKEQYQPSTDAQGLPLGQYRYEPKRLAMEKERNKEYNELLEKTSSNNTPRNVEGPQGLNIDVNYEHRKKAWMEKQRNKDYNEFLKKMPPLRNKGMTPKATSVSLPVGQYDLERPSFEKQRNNEYNELIHTGRIGKRNFREKAPTPPDQQGLPIGQQHYEPMYKAMEHQRNREYNDFLNKKFGKTTSRSTRSEPDRSKTSFYYGNDNLHEEKRKMLDDQRKNEYNKFVKELEPARSKSIDIPTDVESGLPIGQQHHEAWRHFLREQRNHEYNQLVDMKAGETRNRDWNFEQSGVLELHGDEAVQSKQRALRAERQKEYNSYISQLKTPPNHSWPEPAGRGALLVRKGEYDNVRQMYDDQRKREFVDSMQKRREMGLDLPPSTAPPEPLRRSYENTNPMLNVMGRYDDFRRRLVDDRRRDFKSYMDKVKANDTSRHHLISTAPNIAREETPLIHSMGVYDLETRKKVVQERKKDFAEFNHEQQKHWTPRTMVKENLMPHVASAETPLVNYMGKYDKEQLKFRLERNKDLRVYVDKRKRELRNPYDNYVYPTVAVAEKPLVAYMGSDVEQRKRNLREERKRDYEQHKSQQKVKHPDRRHEFVDTASGPYGGLFQGLGDHGNRSEALNKERQREYNEQHAGKEKISGRPNWARDTLPNNTDRGRSSPMKSQPPTDQYQQMLDEKRREEASRRRYDDPEYQGRLAESRERERGEAGPRYGGY